MSMARRVLVVVSIAVEALYMSDPAYGEVPQTTIMMYWEPQAYLVSWEEDALAVAELLKYVPRAFRQLVPPLSGGGTNVCNIPRLKLMLETGVGVSFVNEHANANPYVVVDSFVSKDTALAKAREYAMLYGLRCETDSEGELDTNSSDFDISRYPASTPTASAFCLEVRLEVTRKWAQVFCTQPQGVVFFGGCHVPQWAGAFAFNASASMGYPGGYVNVERAYDDTRGILEYMTGLREEGAHRTFLDAYFRYMLNDYEERICRSVPCIGEPLAEPVVWGAEVELCPVVSDIVPANGETMYYRRVGGACVTFSEVMNTAVPARCLICLPPESAFQKGHEPEWEDLNGNPSDTCISFCYRITGAGGWYAFMAAGNAIAKTKAGALFLDGNGGNPNADNGIAKNGDDHAWQFRVRDCGP